MTATFTRTPAGNLNAETSRHHAPRHRTSRHRKTVQHAAWEPDPADPMALLEQLTVQVRQLWHRAPRIEPEDRERTIVELTSIDLSLERITMRSRWETLKTDDLNDLAGCKARLDRLKHHWTADH